MPLKPSTKNSPKNKKTTLKKRHGKKQWKEKNSAVNGQRQTIDKWMKDNNIDILLMQETKVNHNSKDTREYAVFYYSTNVKTQRQSRARKAKRAKKDNPTANN